MCILAQGQVSMKFELWSELSFDGTLTFWHMKHSGTFVECYAMRRARGVGDSWHIVRQGTPSVVVARSLYGGALKPLDLPALAKGDRVFWYGAGSIKHTGAIVALDDKSDKVAVDDNPEADTYAIVRRRQLQPYMGTLHPVLEARRLEYADCRMSVNGVSSSRPRR